ncbi:DNA glycosylase [Sodiomyces alkalinus F11]|uniref:DNA glycosylase n=1 Tax=Sodiomyces alkalinus (strain CBS 110278 / VKM F-3762 / F11) TaxID=1314773 RepID=A0A3N2Q4P6_SODAK|nr:DNA glycosylase [Sodiomyces alkalinus F11]ROT41585.1 DNA glycosylase [Sodiomyces alkalinus F11]
MATLFPFSPFTSYLSGGQAIKRAFEAQPSISGATPDHANTEESAAPAPKKSRRSQQISSERRKLPHTANIPGGIQGSFQTGTQAIKMEKTTRVLRPRKRRPIHVDSVASTDANSGQIERINANNSDKSKEEALPEEEVPAADNDHGGDTNRSKRIARRTKENPYGLMPGRTPFPDWRTPLPEECEEVYRILTETHGQFQAPEKIAPPSTSVAGCGEVPDLLDAMIRTLISGHTAMKNANLAIQDVIARYGQWDEHSIGAGSIDWNKVRLSAEHEVVEAVKRAGLGPTKGREIKAILEMVYEDNTKRREAYLREKETGEPAPISGTHQLTAGQKDHQMSKIETGVLTLDHIRGMAPDQAMLELTKYPGIGVKTASCLILFCLQQPSFAVDTHVWRFCKWLKWVPPKASRDDTFMHAEVRVPNHLKYGLHQLFIRHGKQCVRCRSITVEGTSDWECSACPLEHLLDRFDKRKSKVQLKVKKKIVLKQSQDDDTIKGEVVETMRIVQDGTSATTVELEETSSREAVPHPQLNKETDDESGSSGEADWSIAEAETKEVQVGEGRFPHEAGDDNDHVLVDSVLAGGSQSEDVEMDFDATGGDPEVSEVSNTIFDK